MDERRSIQDIIPPARSKPLRQPPQMSNPTPSAPPPPPNIPPTPPQPMNLRPEKSNLATIIFICAAVILVIGIGLGLISTVFHRAYVMVTPYTYSAKVDETLQTTPTDATLPYQSVSVTDTARKSVPASGSSHAENHASGTITVYNAFSTGEQKLITNTRFATAAGLIYRIHEPIIVPGYTMKAGVKVPGSIDIAAYADEAGDKYNSDLTQFTIPGLKGSPQYNLITARSKTPMSGGFVGEQAVVDPTLRSQTIDALKGDLDKSIRAKIASATLSGSIIFPSTVAIAYIENADQISGANATISVSATGLAPAFVENALAHQIAGTAGISYGGPLTIPNVSDLTVHADPSSAIGTDTPLTVAISGTAALVSSIDRASLAKDLSGKKKSEIQSVLPQYPGISAIDVKIYPFWLSKLPGNPAKVSIKLVDSVLPVKP